MEISRTDSVEICFGNFNKYPSVKLLAMVGIRNFLDQAEKMGLNYPGAYREKP
jgi:hypothetical protein